jgi:hypothetical protein
VTDPFAGLREPEEPFEILAVPFMGPVIGFVLFGMFFLISVGVAIWWSLGVGLVLVVVLGALTGIFAWHSIPTRIRIDEAGVTFRTKLKTKQVRWEELDSVGTWFRLEDLPGFVVLRLSEGRGDVTIPALEDLHQEELRDHVVSWWKRAGGSGRTFTPISELRETTDMLVGMANQLVEMQKTDNPALARVMSDEEKWGPKPARENEPRRPSGPGVVQLAASESDDDDIYCALMHVLDAESRLYFVVVAGGRTHEPLMAQIRKSIRNKVDEHRDKPEFGGRFDISLVPDLTPMTKHLPAKMDAMVAALSADLADVKTIDGLPITISWTHGHPPKTRAT